MVEDLRALETVLFDFIDKEYFNHSDANYCYIDNVKIHYDCGEALSYELCVKWGRKYDGIDDSKTYLNRHTVTVFETNLEYHNPYIILGQFIDAIKN